MERGITAVTWFPRHHVRRHLLHGFGSCLLRIAVPRRAPRDAVRAWVLRRVLASGGAIGMSHPGGGRRDARRRGVHRGEEGAHLALIMLPPLPFHISKFIVESDQPDLAC